MNKINLIITKNLNTNKLEIIIFKPPDPETLPMPPQTWLK